MGLREFAKIHAGKIKREREVKIMVKKTTFTFKFSGLAAIFLVAIFCVKVYAEQNGIADAIMGQFANNSALWLPVIKKHAISLFWYLAGIQVIIMVIQIILDKKALEEFISDLIKMILVIGFFYALLMNTDWINSFAVSFIKIGKEASRAAGGTANVSVSSILNLGGEIFAKTMDVGSWKHPIDTMFLSVCGLFIFICFILIASELMRAMAEMYIGLNIGVILLAFGALKSTEQIAINYLQFIISIGLKLMVLQVLIGLGESFMRGMLDSFVGNMKYFIFTMGGTVLLFSLVKQTPAVIQGLFRGISGTGGSSMGVMTIAAGAAMIVAKKLGVPAVGGLGKGTWGALKLGGRGVSAAYQNIKNRPKINPFPRI